MVILFGSSDIILDPYFFPIYHGSSDVLEIGSIVNCEEVKILADLIQSSQTEADIE